MTTGHLNPVLETVKVYLQEDVCEREREREREREFIQRVILHLYVHHPIPKQLSITLSSHKCLLIWIASYMHMHSLSSVFN